MASQYDDRPGMTRPGDPANNAGGVMNPGNREYGTMVTPPAGAPQAFDWSSLLKSGGGAPDINKANPYTDIAYNNFYRGMGLDKAQIGAQTARTKTALQASLEAARPAFADQLEDGMRNIGDSAESRGVFRSGRRIDDQSQFQVDQARTQANYESGIRGQMADADASAQTQLQGLARQQAEQELAARTRVAQSQMQNTQNPFLKQLILSAIQG